LSGMLFNNPVDNFVLNRGWGNEMYYPGGFGNMQFFAYYSLESGTGLSVGSQDPAGYTKTSTVNKPDATWLELNTVHVPSFQQGASFTIPYPVVVGFFQGDWFDAATLYRGWAIQRPWAQGGLLATRADVPAWYKQTGFAAYIMTRPWENLRYNFASLATFASQWKAHAQAAPLVEWTFWEKEGAWVESPDFLPPVEGWPSFDLAVGATDQVGA